MRLYVIALLGTAALLTCVSSSSHFNGTKVSGPISAHSDVHGLHSDPANRLMIAQNAANNEERIPPDVASLLVRTMKDTVVDKAVERAMKELPVNRDAYMVTDEAWNQLQELDRHVLTRIAEKLHRDIVGKNLPPAEAEDALYHAILQQPLASKDGEKHLQFAQKNTRSERMDENRPAKKAKKGYTRAEVERLISDLDGSRFKAVEILSIVLNDVAEFAPVLSIAKRSHHISGHIAKQVQQVMLKTWLSSRFEVDAVFGLLKLSKLKKEGFTYENLDTLEEYIDLSNEELGTSIDTLMYLRGKFGDGELALMILEGSTEAEMASKTDVLSHVGDGKPIVQYIDSILDEATNVDTLLDPLLTACGSAAKLAPLLSSVKKSGTSKEKAHRLQRVLLHKRLGKEKSVDYVYDLIGFPI